MSDGVMLVRRFDSFSRYSMPKTESNLPIESANSAEENGMMRANACSTSTVVELPVDKYRGSSWMREKSRIGAVVPTYFRSRSKVLSRNDGCPPMSIDRGKK